jgi:hypothetical protein
MEESSIMTYTIMQQSLGSDYIHIIVMWLSHEQVKWLSHEKEKCSGPYDGSSTSSKILKSWNKKQKHASVTLRCPCT